MNPEVLTIFGNVQAGTAQYFRILNLELYRFLLCVLILN